MQRIHKEWEDEVSVKSIIQKEKQYLVCGNTNNLHSYHIFGGTSNRKQSEKYGLKVWLCAYHHNMSNDGVHFNKHLDNHLKQMGQRHFEARYGNREGFINVFGNLICRKGKNDGREFERF